MRTLQINHLEVPAMDLADIPAWLDGKGETWHPIDCVNWKEYAYKPKAEFRIVSTQEGLIINYRVTEDSIAAVADGDGGKVWEDSCVEFFSSPVDDGTYYNIECNCIGTILVAVGKDRHQRQRASKSVYENVRRWSSLGKDRFEERVGESTWQVVLTIPCSTFFLHDIKTFAGRSIRANVYKCGDKLSNPHFLSWNEIDTPSPDFHRPEFFGIMEF